MIRMMVRKVIGRKKEWLVKVVIGAISPAKATLYFKVTG